MPLNLVSTNSSQDINRRIASDNLAWPLRELAANLMRITRGAGHGYRITAQVMALAEALGAYEAAHGHGPPEHFFQQALYPDKSWKALREDWLNSKDFDDVQRHQVEREDLARDIRNACLQITASQLLGQKPQEAQGDHAFWNSFYALRDAHEAFQAAFAKRLAATQKGGGRKRRSTKPWSL